MGLKKLGNLSAARPLRCTHNKIQPRAQVRLDADGRLAITTWFVEPTGQGRDTVWISPGESWLGVPFHRWSRHRGRVIDLSGWRGTEAGMRGGPQHITIAAILSDKFDTLSFRTMSEAMRALVRLEADFADPRIKYVGLARDSMVRYIQDVKAYINNERIPSGRPLYRMPCDER